MVKPGVFGGLRGELLGSSGIEKKKGKNVVTGGSPLVGVIKRLHIGRLCHRLLNIFLTFMYQIYPLHFSFSVVENLKSSSKPFPVFHLVNIYRLLASAARQFRHTYSKIVSRLSSFWFVRIFAEQTRFYDLS